MSESKIEILSFKDKDNLVKVRVIKDGKPLSGLSILNFWSGSQIYQCTEIDEGEYELFFCQRIRYGYPISVMIELCETIL